MSEFFCRDVYALLEHEPAALPEIALPYQPVKFTTPPDEELVAAVRQVCAAGWFWALANRTRVTGHLDDIIQTTFLNVWRTRDTFDPAYPIVCRVARIARNALIDIVRQQSRRRANSLYDDEGEQRNEPADRRAGPIEEALGHEMDARLREAVASVPAQVRQLLPLLDRGLTFEQAAAALGKKKAAVVSAYHRWKVATLARLLKE